MLGCIRVASLNHKIGNGRRNEEDEELTSASNTCTRTRTRTRTRSKSRTLRCSNRRCNRQFGGNTIGQDAASGIVCDLREAGSALAADVRETAAGTFDGGFEAGELWDVRTGVLRRKKTREEEHTAHWGSPPRFWAATKPVTARMRRVNFMISEIGGKVEEKLLVNGFD